MNELYSTVIISLISMTGVIVPAYLLHVRETRKYKVEIKKQKQEINEHELKGDILNKILDLTLLTKMKDAVQEIIQNTQADRFLILIAINGKVDFHTVSVIFEQHKNSTSSAIAAYRSLKVDNDYVQMLKRAEKEKIVELNVSRMRDSLLKTVYMAEGVTFSQIHHVQRVVLNNDNDCLIFASVATHNKRGFTEMGKIKIQVQIDSVIKPAIEKMIF